MEKRKINPYMRLLEFASQCKGKMIASVMIAILSVACGILPYFAVAKITVLVLENNQDFTKIFQFMVVALLGYTGKVVFHGISTTLSHQSAYQILKNIRTMIVNKLSKLPLGDVLNIPSGEYKTIIVDTVEKMEQPLAHIIPEMTSNLLIPICVLAYLFYLNYKVAIASLITIPVGLVLYKLLMKKYMYYYPKRIDAKNNMNSTVVEYINGIEAIKAFNQSSKSYERYYNSIEENRKTVTTFFKKTLLLYTAVMYSIPSTLLFVLPIGLYLYKVNMLTLSTFVTCIILSFGLISPLIIAMKHTDGIASLGTNINQICNIIDSEEMNRPSKNKTINDYTIKFNNVSFGYGDQDILHNVSFKTIPNGMTAIVGPSGSGKSTIAKLIASFWEVKSGKITLGGIDVRDIPLDQISDVISYVSQENFLFNMSIKDNIRIGNKNATDEEIIEAAKKASCHDFIMKLENGYNTIAGEGGNHFSGGERQRISIARAILKNSPIVVLDEATAYTDPENEAIIQNSISKLVKGKTLIVIAHRLSTIASADNIIVVKDGSIVAEGIQTELLQNSPLYKSMWEAHMDSKDGDTLEGVNNNAKNN